MIGYLSGTVRFSGENHILLEVGGVGYKVFVALETLRTLKKGSPAELWTYLAVRENALDLYGFSSKKELSFFEMLITIPGVGPKSALGVLNVAPAETLERAVSAGDTSYLTKVSGIGKKMAEKIVVELRDKIGAIDTPEAGAALQAEGDVLDALQSLGYSLREAREVAKNIPDNVVGTEARVKEALKKLGNHES